MTRPKVIRMHGGRVVVKRALRRGWYANAERRDRHVFAFGWFESLGEVRRWAHEKLA